MAVWYVDPDSGSDSNTGTSFAQAFAKVNGATAAKGVAAGDTIRIKASPPPTSIGSATWTTDTSTVVLAAALTKHIETCESAWTASANVTATASSSAPRQGSNRANIVIAAGFTTGKVAYKALGSTEDFSAYQQVSFAIFSSVALAAGDLKLKLCSDTTGDTPVDSISIPAVTNGSVWTVFTVDLGAALGSAIQSVALYQDTDVGAVTIALDNILACKASSADDALSLTSLIGKNAGDEWQWFAIRAIDDTTVYLDHQNSAFTYVGTTETVTTYRRECFKTYTVGGTNHWQTQVSGSAGSPITISGGWNRTDMSTQDDETWIDSCRPNNAGNGLVASGSSGNWLNFERLGFVRYFSGMRIESNNARSVRKFDRVYWVTGSNTTLISSGGTAVFTRCQLLGQFILMDQTQGQCKLVECWWGQSTLNFNHGSHLVVDSMARSIIGNGENSRFIDCHIQMSGAGQSFDAGAQCLRCTVVGVSPTIIPSSTTLNYNRLVQFHDYNDTPGDHRHYNGMWVARSEQGGNRRTASGLGWSLAPLTTDLNVDQPAKLRLATPYLKASVANSISVYVKRSNTGLTAKLVFPGRQLLGVDNDVEASVSAAADTWEKLTIEVTPSESGVGEVYLYAYGGSTYTAYADDMEFA